MNEEHKKRGIMHSKFFTAVAISALLLGSGNVMATQTAESSIYGVAEQLQTITVTGVVLDATDRKSTRLNSSHTQKSRMPSSA